MTTKTVLVIVSVALLLYPVGVFVFLAGRAKGRAEANAASRILELRCPCGHAWGAHEDGLRCQDDVKRPFYYSNGSRNGWEYVRCSCTKYHGPAVLDVDDLFRSSPRRMLPS